MDSTPNNKCCNCIKSLRKIPGRIKKIVTYEETLMVRQQLQVEAKIGDILCEKCRRLVIFGTKLYKVNTSHNSAEQSSPSQSSTTTSSDPSSSQGYSQDPSFKPKVSEKNDDLRIELPLKRVIATHRICFLCRNTTSSLCINVPIEARLQCFSKRKIFIPHGNRACSNHFIHKRFYEEDLAMIECYSNTSFIYQEELTLFLEKMADSTDNALFGQIGSLLSDERIKVLTGFSYEQLNEISDLLISMRNSDQRSKLQALIIFMFKLRTGNSNAVIASIFNLDREQIVSDFSTSVQTAFEKDILPTRFGPNSISRNDLIQNHTAPCAKRLYNITNQLAFIFDGTYLRHQKSRNNEYQRKSYSGMHYIYNLLGISYQ